MGTLQLFSDGKNLLSGIMSGIQMLTGGLGGLGAIVIALRMLFHTLHGDQMRRSNEIRHLYWVIGISIFVVTASQITKYVLGFFGG
ncbi:hypothetical protein LLE49_19805 [Alicyclobacillus tolerans]|uniref:hypothetical protein n=1 Tax=Alicyclobacillus tolerans TaxID=90970 RepID=UPI001F1CADAC|nr:hypothetical protein [Alicyclobacillus tolerans]MCF8566969.1 hypothetical protein [Alicyclobacillus tolerans]